MKSVVLFRRYVLPVICGLAMLASAGCTPVYSRKVIGSAPAENLQSYEGVWRQDEPDKANQAAADQSEKPFRLKIADRSAGKLKASGVDKNGKQQTIDMYVRTLGPRTFLSFNSEDKERPGMFAFGLVVAHGKNSIIVVGPKAETIARLVDAKQLRGTSEVNSDKQLKGVTLDDLSPEEAEKLFLPANMDSFYWDLPLVWIREGR